MLTILMMVTLGLLKIKVLSNIDHDVILCFHDITNKIFSCNCNYIVDGAMWPKFVNSSISMKEVIVKSVL